MTRNPHLRNRAKAAQKVGGLAVAARRLVQHVEKKPQLAGEAVFPGARVAHYAGPKRGEEVERLRNICQQPKNK